MRIFLSFTKDGPILGGRKIMMALVEKRELVEDQRTEIITFAYFVRATISRNNLTGSMESSSVNGKKGIYNLSIRGHFFIYFLIAKKNQKTARPIGKTWRTNSVTLTNLYSEH